MTTTATRPRADVLDRIGTPRPGPDVPPAEATLLLVRRPSAVVRFAFTPVLLAFGLTAAEIDPVFWGMLAFRVAWLGTGLENSKTAKPRRYPLRFAPVIDSIVLAGLLAGTGGVDSPVAIPMLLVPLTSGLLVGRGQTALTGGYVLLAFLLPSVPELLDDPGRALGMLGRVAAGVAFATGAGIGLAQRRLLLTQHAASIDAARRRLLGASLSAEDEERRRVSGVLSGEALRLLLQAARDVGAGAEDGLRRAQDGVRATVVLLRETVRDLHPAAARHVGLPAALRISMEHRLASDVAVRVDPDAVGSHDELLLTLARAVADTAARFATPGEVSLRVRREPAEVVLGIDLDGSEKLRARLRDHRELVEAEGGTLAVARTPSGRSAITVRLPVAEAGRSPDEAHDDEEADRLARIVLAWLRVAALPVALLAAIEGGEAGTAFLAVLGVAALGGLVQLAVAVSPAWPRNPFWLAALVDMAVAGGLLALSGGADSELRALTLTFPLLLGFIFPPGRLALLTGVLATGYVAGAAGAVLDGEPGALGQALAWLLALAWAAFAGFVLQRSLQRVAERTEELERARRRVLHTGLAAADRERRRLSERLHDEALQTLMVCGQELDEALDGEPGALDRARAELDDGLALLRDTAAELHPPALEHDGLRAALEAVAERGARLGGFAVGVSVAEAASGRHDGFVVALVRELVTNAAKHARADRVDVQVGVDAAGCLSVDVQDDGDGMAPGRAAAAIAAGHIGLAAARERVEAEGGRFSVTSTPGLGTRVSARVPD